MFSTVILKVLNLQWKRVFNDCPVLYVYFSDNLS
jgi:hypothetical protein